MSTFFFTKKHTYAKIELGWSIPEWIAYSRKVEALKKRTLTKSYLLEGRGKWKGSNYPLKLLFLFDKLLSVRNNN